MKPLGDIALSLFETSTLESPDAPLREQMEGIEWSYSKRNTEEQCPRKYYFHYYGASARTAKEEQQKPLLRKLKTLQNRHERTGEIVHFVIANSLRKAQQGDTPDADRLASWARKIFNEDVLYSRSPKTQAAPTVKYPPAELLEFYYQQGNAVDMCAEAEAKMLRALHNFARDARIGPLRAFGSRQDAKIEQIFRLEGFPCRITGVVDLAGTQEGILQIVDWKSGNRGAGEDDSLQLTVYAMWGARQYQCDIGNVIVSKAFLGSGDVVPYKSDLDSAARARKRILQDAERMAAMHPYGLEGRVRAFTACAHAKVCALCPYVAACPEGKESLYG